MERTTGSGEDMELRLMIQVKEKNDDTVRKTMDDIGLGDYSLEDLEYEQLLDLKNALDSREEWKTR